MMAKHITIKDQGSSRLIDSILLLLVNESNRDRSGCMSTAGLLLGSTDPVSNQPPLRAPFSNKSRSKVRPSDFLLHQDRIFYTRVDLPTIAAFVGREERGARCGERPKEQGVTIMDVTHRPALPLSDP
jgi:hypothetical protein